MADADTQSYTAPDTDHSVSPAVSVIVPVYNERPNLPILLDELTNVFRIAEMQGYRPYEILFVEDGSSDGTSQWIDDAAAHNPHVRAVHLKRNYGQSAALQAGFDLADGRVLVPMDGDLQNDPHDIPRLLDKLEEGYDCVSGWRRNREDPWHKTIPSAIQTRLAKLTGPAINDFGCTLTAYRRDAIKDIDLYGEGHRYIPAKLYDKGHSVAEVEVNHRPRKHGESRYGAGRLLRGFVDLAFHYYWVHYSTRPLHVFGLLGFLSMGAGGFIGLVSVVQKYVFGVSLAPRTPRLILVSLLVMFGLQLLVFGVLAEMLTKLHYRDEREYRVARLVE